MNSRARVCSQCGALSAAEDTRCYRCGERLYPAWFSRTLASVTGLFGDRSPMTAVLFGLCILQFALMSLVAGFSFGGGFRLSDLLRWGALFVDVEGQLVGAEPWRYLSAAFFHFGIVHLGFNMMALGSLGGALEPKLGSARFAITYVVCGIVGFVVSDYWSRLGGEPRITGGASGALFGFMGAIATYQLAMKDPAWKRSLMGALVLFGVMTFLIPASMMRLDNAAHGGGLAAGMLLGYMFGKERRAYLRARAMQVIAALCVLGSIGSLVASQVSETWKLQRQIEIQYGHDLDRS